MKLLKRLHMGILAAVIMALLVFVTAFADETEPGSKAGEAATQMSSEAETASGENNVASEPDTEESTVDPETTTESDEPESTTESEPESTTEPEPLNGWDEEHTCYYVNDEKVTGLYEIKGVVYGFNTDGKLVKNTWLTIDGVSYGLDEEGKLYTENTLKEYTNSKGGKYYRGYNQDGKMVKGSWLTVGSDAYGFDENGSILKNKVQEYKNSKGGVYYRGYDKTGKMVKNNWLTVGGSKYYFNANGSMLLNTVIKIGNYYYGFGSDGKMLTGFQTIKGAKYYFNPSTGIANVNGIKSVDGKSYNFAPDGKMLTGKRKVGDYSYYFDSTTGEMVKDGVHQLDGVYYGFDKNGRMLKGWQTINGSKYYFNKSTYQAYANCVKKIGSYQYGFDSTAKLVRGWFTLNGDHYYFRVSNAHGYKNVTRKIDGVKYVFDSTGKEKTGWVTISKTKYYYVPETGKLANGIVVVNGKAYNFKNGKTVTGGKTGASNGRYYIVKSDGSLVTGKGWTKYNGFYYYFLNDGYSILMDTESVIDPAVRKQYGFIVKINKKMCTVTVYAYNTKDKQYNLPVRSFVCSPGQRTPTGWHTITTVNRWVRLVGPTEDTYTYGQWGMLYNIGENDDGSLSKRYFHSVYYDQNPADTNPKSPNYDVLAEKFLNVRAWNMLGKICSHGCIRMETVNVKWLYKLFKEDIISKTKAATYNGGKGNVYIYESSVAGPYGKMAACCKLPSWHTWDPTDPNMKYKCQEKGCHNY